MSKDAGCVEIKFLFLNLVHDLEKVTTAPQCSIKTLGSTLWIPVLRNTVALRRAFLRQKRNSRPTPDSGDTFNKLRPPGQDSPTGFLLCRPSSCFSN